MKIKELKRSDDLSDLKQAALELNSNVIGGKAGTVEISKIDLTKNIREVNITDNSFLALKESIQEQGLLQRPVIAKVADGKYICLGGHRRILALQELGHESVPCILHPLDKEDIDGTFAKLAENIIREDLNPIDMAITIDKVKSSLATTKTGLSRILEKDRHYITWMLKIASWSEKNLNFARNHTIGTKNLFLIAKSKDQSEETVSKKLEQLVSGASQKRQGATSKSYLEKRNNYFKANRIDDSTQKIIVDFLKENRIKGWY